MGPDTWTGSHRGAVAVVAAALPVLACWLLSLARAAIANTTAAIGLVLLVVAAAATGSRVAGLLAALTAAAGFDFFLTAPFHTLAIHSAGDVETAVLLLVIGAAVSEIALWGRRQQAEASREQGYLDGLLTTTTAASSGRLSAGQVRELVREQLRLLLRIDDVRFRPGSGGGLPTVQPDGRLLRGGHEVDVERRGLPTDSDVVLPVRSGGAVVGHYLLTSATRVVRPTRDQLRIAVHLADQVGRAGAVAPPSG